MQFVIQVNLLYASRGTGVQIILTMRNEPPHVGTRGTEIYFVRNTSPACRDTGVLKIFV